MSISSNHKKIILGVLFTGVCLLVSFFIKRDFSRMIWADAEGYYQYLTAIFIQHDLKIQPYAYFLPDGTAFNKYNYGVAFLQLPFFLLGFLYSHLTGAPLTGHTAVNGFFMVLSTVIYVFFGLLFTYEFLKRQFSPRLSILSLVILFCGTNLFYYTLIESGLSHAYSFFLIAFLIWQTPRFLEKPDWRNTLLCAIPLAMAAVIRPTNLAAGLFLLLYDIHSGKDLVQRFRFLFRSFHIPFIFAGTLLLFYLPQFYYWHLTTGKWIVYSYHYSYIDNENFRYWKKPKMLQVMFGVESGWLVYTPLMALSVAGMVLAFIRKTTYSWAILIIFIVIWYTNASWWLYSFACGFGYRILVDYYGLMAIAFTLTISELQHIPSKYIKAGLLLLAVFLCFLNIRMSVFYDAIPCWFGPNWEWRDYWMIVKMMLR